MHVLEYSRNQNINKETKSLKKSPVNKFNLHPIPSQCHIPQVCIPSWRACLIGAIARTLRKKSQQHGCIASQILVAFPQH